MRSRRRQAGRSLLLPILLALALVVAGVNAAAATGEEAWAPVPRVGALLPAMILDPVRDRLVTFAGVDGDGNVSADVWAKPLAGDGTWTRLDIAGARPAPRTAAAALYDPVRDRMLVFGDTYAGDGGGIVWALALSGTPAWTALTEPGDGPGFRSGPSAIYDPARDRMVVFGGYSAAADSDMDDVWALSLGDAPAWSRLLPSGVPPSRRTLASMVLDPAGGRLVVFGGFQDLRSASVPGPAVARDTWAMSLGDAPAWTELHPGGDVVPRLFECAAAFDPVRGRMLAWGGFDSIGSYRGTQETWALRLDDPVSWTRLAPAAPIPASGAGAEAAFDAARDRLVLFGGSSMETWALSLAGSPVWTRLEAGDAFGPGGRYGHSAVYDSARASVLLFGGAFYDDGGGHHARTLVFDDLWRLTFSPRPEWTAVVCDSVPPPGWGHAMILDPVTDRLVVFGGTKPNLGDGPADVMDSDLWQLDLASGATWRFAAAGDSVPPARAMHTAVYDAARRRMLVFGGIDPPNVFGDVWALALDGPPRWTRLAIPGPGPGARYGHGAIYDPVGDRMIVFGGSDGTTLLDDTWQLALAGTPAWSPLSSDAHPPGRLSACMVYDGRRQRVVLFGGSAYRFLLYGGSQGDLMDDTWLLPLAEGASWMPAAVAGASPDPRSGASAVFVPDRDLVVVTGGQAAYPLPLNLSGSWAMTSSDVVPAPLVLESVHAGPRRVVLAWSGSASDAPSATVERRSGADAWAALGTARSEGPGLLGYLDATAAPGTRYAYRLSWSVGASARTSAEVWVDVPRLHFDLAGATPNPASRGLTVLFSLPDAAAARLDVTDAAGRRVLSRDVGGLGPGDHALAVTAPGALPAGIYFVRLARGGETRVKRACVVR